MKKEIILNEMLKEPLYQSFEDFSVYRNDAVDAVNYVINNNGNIKPRQEYKIENTNKSLFNIYTISSNIFIHHQTDIGSFELNKIGEWVHTDITGATLGCNHEWKEYVGFTQKYNYCIKCDEKNYT